MQQFEGKVALVTGGAGGIGRASAKAFAAGGARIVVADINPDSGQALVHEIREAGAEAVYVNADVTRETVAQHLVNTALDTFGGLDIAFNNAGFQWGNSGFLDTTPEQWDQTLNLSLKATWMGMKAQIIAMQAAGGGVIVNTTSMAGWRTHMAANAAYSAAKRGVISLTEYAAVEFASDNIRVNAIAPGLVRTEAVKRLFSPEVQNEMAADTQPIGRIIEPEEVAAAAVFLCSPQAAMITGMTMPVCGGNNAN